MAKTETKPIMVGDVNIEPMTQEQLIEMNRGFVNKIYSLRLEQSNCRREMDLIMQHINNTRKHVEAVKSKRLILLSEYEKHDPKVLDELKAARGEMNFLIYDTNLKTNELKEKLDKQMLVMGESVSDEEKDDPVVKQLKMRTRNSYTLLQKINRRLKAKKIAYNLRSTKMLAKKRLIKRMTKMLNNRADHAEKLYLKRLSYLKNCYENRLKFFELEDNKYWHRFKDIMEKHYEDCELTEKTYLRRHIMNEELMAQACIEYSKKIEQSKEKINHYEEILNLAKKEEIEINNEMTDLRKKSSIVKNNQNTVVKLKKIIKEMKEEYNELVNENKSMNEKFIKIDKVWRNYGDIIEACNELWSMNNTDDNQLVLNDLLSVVSKRVSDRLKEMLGKLSDNTRNLVCESIKFFIDRLRPLQYEIIKNVKAYNELVEYGEKYIRDYNFNNKYPFKPYRGIKYRKLPARAYNYVCCDAEEGNDLAFHQDNLQSLRCH
ncbi:hypothetical protein O3M35_000380 [Rhynocoris fuscipes]|uniref:Uncharacterized protein n=1 Tax=Rhynocoris fuscipes TaxID=488301 RepID=A0AAW1DN74_9HEMI